MYAKYIVLFCLLGLSALLPAQAADQNRINIRIFPSQVLSVTTVHDSKNDEGTETYNRTNQKKELTASNLYGYQIKLINEKQSSQTGIIDTRPSEKTNECSFHSKLIYSKTSSATDQKIPTSYLAPIQRENLNKCLLSTEDKLFVYLIITQ